MMDWTRRAQVVDAFLINEWPLEYSARAYFRRNTTHFLAVRDYFNANPGTAEIARPLSPTNEPYGPGTVLVCFEPNRRNCSFVDDQGLREALNATTWSVVRTRAPENLVFTVGAVNWNHGSMSVATIETSGNLPTTPNCGSIDEITEETSCHKALADGWYLHYDWISNAALSRYENED